MNGRENIIGLTELLDEVSRDLDDFRRKHPGDYSLKGVTLWWDTEKERLLVRHAPSSLIKAYGRAKSVRKTLAWFTAGWVSLIAVQTAMRYLVG